MARKRNATAAETAAQPDAVSSDTGQLLQKGAQDQHGAEAEHTAASPGPEEAANGPTPRLIRETFTSSRAGIRAGEDKRFNAPQVFIDFDDDRRATAEEKSEMNQAGFRYRPKDKGYSALATGDTRQARDELAQKFTERRLKEKTGQGEGNER